MIVLHQLIELATAVTPTPEPQVVDKNKVQPGWLGLGILVAMIIAVVFLGRSLIARLKNIDVDRHAREQAAKREASESGNSEAI